MCVGEGVMQGGCVYVSVCVCVCREGVMQGGCVCGGGWGDAGRVCVCVCVHACG